jgi:hypothetical protein
MKFIKSTCRQEFYTGVILGVIICLFCVLVLVFIAYAFAVQFYVSGQ